MKKISFLNRGVYLALLILLSVIGLARAESSGTKSTQIPLSSIPDRPGFTIIDNSGNVSTRITLPFSADEEKIHMDKIILPLQEECATKNDILTRDLGNGITVVGIIKLTAAETTLSRLVAPPVLVSGAPLFFRRSFASPLHCHIFGLSLLRRPP